jgi:hypothetical protein
LLLLLLLSLSLSLIDNVAVDKGKEHAGGEDLSLVGNLPRIQS